MATLSDAFTICRPSHADISGAALMLMFASPNAAAWPNRKPPEIFPSKQNRVYDVYRNDHRL